MPWKVVSRSGRFAVVSEETGATVKVHPTKEAAEAHVRALYANSPEYGGAKRKGHRMMER